ncbi:MAG: hypothetical protein GOV15_01440 [Candidatus Diapherotrites archaeon]|nr:hypothetical protein [Candidatus Diapherotrites archaeon]
MKSITVAVLGDDAKNLCKKLGKKDTVTELEYYNHEEKEFLVTFVTPRDYPEKIQGVINALALADHVVLSVKQVSKENAELILAIESTGHVMGTLILDGVSKEEIQPYIQNTLVEKYPIVTQEELIEHLKTAGLPEVPAEPSVTIIDQFFNVKGIGTVALGKVEQGSLRSHTKMQLLPLNKEVTIRSIQMHDRDVKEAPTFARVGTALKGVEADEIGKGDVLTDDKEMKKRKTFTLEFTKLPFYKKEINPGDSFHLSLSLQTNPVKVKKVNEKTLELESEKAFVLLKAKAVLIDLNNPGLRIAGYGTIQQ